MRRGWWSDEGEGTRRMGRRSLREREREREEEAGGWKERHVRPLTLF